MNIKKIAQSMQVSLKKYPKFFDGVVSVAQFFLGRYFMPWPRTMRNEVRAVKKVLRTPFWNMSYASTSGIIKPVHLKLEEEFAAYVGAKHAVAVNTGGMAIQMTLRGLGVSPGDEVVHRVDTCCANPFAVYNAGAVPIFADIHEKKLTTSKESIENVLSARTKVLMPIHMWGYSEDMDMIQEVSKKNNLLVVEDCCLSLGTKWNGNMVGTLGIAGIFSFGCMKPMQTGEGGMIVTNDESLAKELRTMRSYGDMSVEYGIRDQKTLSWNGRMSEIVAAVGLEQLRAYPKHIEKIRENVAIFLQYMKNIEGIDTEVNSEKCQSSYTQVVVKIDERLLEMSKKEFITALDKEGVKVWHAGFELLNSLAFFKEGHWKKWAPSAEQDRIEKNYRTAFEHANTVFEKSGIGFYKSLFISRKQTLRLIKTVGKVLKI